MEVKESVWVIVSKDRKVIAKGVPRNRYLISIDDKNDKKRILTYASKGKAEAGFKDSYFYQDETKLGKHYSESDLEAVEASFSISF